VSLRDHVAAIARGDTPPPPVATLLGMRFLSWGDGEAVFEMDAAPEHGNPMGNVQGGILCALADAAMGLAFASTLEGDDSFTTLELKMNYLRGVREGTLTAKGRVITRGRTIGLTECTVTDSEGRIVAHATSTCMALEPR
jgi:uncharacterized protein (TIGR00369 family)